MEIHMKSHDSRHADEPITLNQSILGDTDGGTDGG